MIYCLTGELIFTDALSYTAVIDCAGVGYKVSVTGNTFNTISTKLNETVRLYTHMSIKDDAVDLYGFSNTEEMTAFKLLLGVSGVGPKAACAILTAMTPQALSLAILKGDTKAIAKSQGVGTKTAARIVIDLKDKFGKAFPTDETAEGIPEMQSDKKARGGGKLSDARDALCVLGFSRAEASRAIEQVDTSGNVEDIIRLALACLMK